MKWPWKEEGKKKKKKTQPQNKANNQCVNTLYRERGRASLYLRTLKICNHLPHTSIVFNQGFPKLTLQFSRTVPWPPYICTFIKWTLTSTMRLIIAIYKDTVPWPYMKWTVIEWEQETHPLKLMYDTVVNHWYWTLYFGMMDWLLTSVTIKITGSSCL